MDPVDVKPLLEGLDENLDDLEEALEPLLKTATSSIASKLPLLDKAKVYVLTAYAIESLLFSSLQLNGVKAKDHAVFTELTRLKQYFAKIKEAETGPKQRALTVDKAAAGRFIKHALSGNDRYDSDKYNRMMKEKTNTERQKAGHIKFNEAAEHLKQEQISSKKKADEGDDLINEEEDDDSDSDSSEPEATTLPTESGKDATDRSTGQEAESTAEDFMELEQDSEDQRKKGKKQKKRERQRQKKRKRHDEDAVEGDDVTTTDEATQDGKKKKKRRSIGQESHNQSPIVRKGSKKSKQDKGKAPESVVPRKTKSNVAPKGHSEAFQALLKGPIERSEKSRKKSKSKSRKSEG